MKRRLLIGLYVTALFATSFSVIEYFVRRHVITRNIEFYRVTDELVPIYRLTDSYRSTHLNIRQGRRITSHTGARRKKIAFVGDSSTFGVGTMDSQTFPEQLQRGQSDWDALNFGVPGYGFNEILKVTSEILDREKPDALVYLYNFNDPFVSMAMFFPLLLPSEKRDFFLNEFEGKKGRAKLWTKEHLKSWVVLSHILSGQAKPWHPSEIDFESYPCTPSVDSYVVQGELEQGYRSMEVAYASPRVTQRIKDFLTKMKSTVEGSGAKFVVLFDYPLPFFTHVGKTPIDSVSKLVRELSIPHIDTYPTYAQNFKECHFYSDHGHPGKLGNALLAKLTIDYLKKQGF